MRNIERDGRRVIFKFPRAHDLLLVLEEISKRSSTGQ
jgi:hypothetical protein